MKATELALKSPSVPPFFQRGNFLRYSFNPSLEKRERGDFLGVRRELFGELIKFQAATLTLTPFPLPERAREMTMLIIEKSERTHWS
jgi:hypothetical protein